MCSVQWVFGVCVCVWYIHWNIETMSVWAFLCFITIWLIFNWLLMRRILTYLLRGLGLGLENAGLEPVADKDVRPTYNNQPTTSISHHRRALTPVRNDTKVDLFFFRIYCEWYRWRVHLLALSRLCTKAVARVTEISAFDQCRSDAVMHDRLRLVRLVAYCVRCHVRYIWERWC